MKKRRRAAGSTGIRSLIHGVLINFAVYAALTLIFTVIAYMSDDPLGLTVIFPLAVILVCGAICGFTVSKRSEGRYTALLCALIFSLIMLIFGICISGNAPRIRSVINCLIYLAASAIFSRLATAHTARSGIKHRRGG